MNNRDEQARGLYTQAQFNCDCGEPITLYYALRGRCPRCERIVVAGPDATTPETARQVLAEIEARRRELGLGVLTKK
jgi:hypothetical protein